MTKAFGMDPHKPGCVCVRCNAIERELRHQVGIRSQTPPTKAITGTYPGVPAFKDIAAAMEHFKDTRAGLIDPLGRTIPPRDHQTYARVPMSMTMAELEMVTGKARGLAGGVGGAGGNGGRGVASTHVSGVGGGAGGAGGSSTSRGQRVRQMEKCTRVQFATAKLAYVLLEPLLDSPFAVQVTTFPPPRARDVYGVEGPAITLDFVEDSWLPDVVRLLRDLTVPLSERMGMVIDQTTSTVLPMDLTPAKAASVLGLILDKGHDTHHALEGGWRAGGRDFIAKCLRDFIVEHAGRYRATSHFFGEVV